MPSAAATQSQKAFANARLLRVAAATQPQAAPRMVQIYYHASLAASVASWDAYLNSIVLEFFSKVADPLDPKFFSMTQIANEFAKGKLLKFNTPNFENARDLLLVSTGYDPYSHWDWKARSMNVLGVRELLNQILKVRHSFAHGFSLPAFGWTQSPAGKRRLTQHGVETAERLLNHLVKRSDRGLSAHLYSTYGVRTGW